MCNSANTAGIINPGDGAALNLIDEDGGGSNTGCFITHAGSITAFSDQRKKKSIRVKDTTQDKYKQLFDLDLVTFMLNAYDTLPEGSSEKKRERMRWKSTRLDTGLLAQQVLTLFP